MSALPLAEGLDGAYAPRDPEDDKAAERFISRHLTGDDRRLVIQMLLGKDYR